MVQLKDQKPFLNEWEKPIERKPSLAERLGFVKNKHEIIGAITGMLGAVSIALNVGIVALGFILFLVSSVSLTIAFAKQKKWWLVAMQVVYTAINILGIINWIGV